MLSHETRGVLY